MQLQINSQHSVLQIVKDTDHILVVNQEIMKIAIRCILHDNGESVVLVDDEPNHGDNMTVAYRRDLLHDDQFPVIGHGFCLQLHPLI